ncbi:MAG: CPBP family intramembrane metalloprotease [Chloroflexi bacterium]|nr:CPBP family intramembrane metalloprotease [Chloroflexota bacterium]
MTAPDPSRPDPGNGRPEYLPRRAPQEEPPDARVTGEARWSTGDVARAAAVALATIIAMAGAAVLIASLRRPDEDIALPGGLWLLAIQTGVLAGAAWLFSIRKYGGGIAALGFRPAAGRRPYLFAAGVWIAALAAAAAWSALMMWGGPEWLKPPDSAGGLTERFGANLGGLIVVAVVWGPVGEELFFRGFVLPGLIRRLGAPAAVVVSSGLFAVFHVDPGSLVPTFLLGAALAWIYLKTGSIWPSIMAHGMQNALALWVAGAS